MTFDRRFLAALALGLTMAPGLAAATEVRVIRTYAGDQPLTRPERVVVYDFAVPSGEVKLDSGPGARLLRRLGGDSQAEEQAKVGREVAANFADELVKAIGELGLPAERAPRSPSPAAGTLAVDGQFVSIDEGNRARRMVVGFGAGATEVSALVQVYLGMPAGPVLVHELEAKGESSKKPGAAVTMGAGAAAGAAAAAGGAVNAGLETRATVEADARRAAREVAKGLGELFARQGWIVAK